MKVTLNPQRGITNKGLCYFCSNFKKDPRGGMSADYVLTNVVTRTASATTALLERITEFVERKDSDGSNSTIFGKCDTNGHLMAGDLAMAYVFRTSDYSKTVSAARGLAVDTGGEIIYTGNQYLGRTFTSTLDGAVTAADNTIDVIDASDFPTAGYCFIKDGIGANSETIQYTGKATNQLTGVTRGKFFSTDRNHGTGLEIVAFDDDWQDLGAAVTTDRRPVIKFGDYNLIGNVNKIAGWKETDFSDWSTSLVTLPADYEIVDFSLFSYGSIPMVMIAANTAEQTGMLFFATRDDIVNGTYTRYVPVEKKIQKIYKNYVATKSGIYQTDGFILKLVAALPDDYKEIRSSDFAIYDIKSKENFLLITANCVQLDRNRTGLWILDLDDRSWYYVLPSSYGTYDIGFGAIFISSGSSNNTILVSTDYGNGAIDALTTGAKARGNYYQLVYQPPDAKTYKLQTITLNLYTKLKTYFNDKNYNFDVIVRYYDFKRPFLQYGQIAAASGTNQLIISNSLGEPAVGDRVEVISRRLTTHADIAAAPRNITAISTGATTHTLTLDEVLPATPTADSQLVLINPLKKIEKVTISGSSIDPEDLEIKVPDMPEFKKLMIEVEIRYTETGTSVGLASLDLEFTPK